MSIDFIKKSKGKKIMVQMKNGVYMNGVLEDIDRYMNIAMKDITYTNSKEKEGKNLLYSAPNAFIRGSQIASITFEEDLLEQLGKKASVVIPQGESKEVLSQPQNQFLSRKRNYEGDDREGNNKMYRGRGGNDRNDRGSSRGRGFIERGRGRGA